MNNKNVLKSTKVCITENENEIIMQYCETEKRAFKNVLEILLKEKIQQITTNKKNGNNH
jgi:UDP-N-acetylglucosamine transferase subunit ALG13